MSLNVSFADTLKKHTKEGSLFTKMNGDWVECYSCGHRCKIKPGKDGICKVRFNEGGKLFVPWGYVNSVALDPIEKKPFFHVLPGSGAVSFGMVGCDYHCSFCQNWISSQILRDQQSLTRIEPTEPENIVMLAHDYKAQIITSTYNEPLITTEWAVDIFKIAKQYGLVTGYVSNGNGTPEVLDYLKPYLDLFKIDLKGFDDKRYRELGGVLQNVLDTIKLAYEKAFWVEVVTLVVPGFNDSDEELKQIASFLVSVSPDIPWHVTAFHPEYKMTDRSATPGKTLLRASEIGKAAGLNYVYAGNLPGRVGGGENTYCPTCKELLVERYGYKILKNQLADGECFKCKRKIAGFWKV